MGAPFDDNCSSADMHFEHKCEDHDHLSALDVLEDIDHPMTHQELHETLENDPDYLFSLL